MTGLAKINSSKRNKSHRGLRVYLREYTVTATEKESRRDYTYKLQRVLITDSKVFKYDNTLLN